MHLKQWNAVMELTAQALAVVWVLLNMGKATDLQSTAAMLLWAGGIIVVMSVVGAITVSILIGMARRDGRREDRADERDRVIFGKAMRNAYVPASLAGFVTLIALAAGWDATSAIYILFFGGMVAGAIEAVSTLVYYWTS